MLREAVYKSTQCCSSHFRDHTYAKYMVVLVVVVVIINNDESHQFCGVIWLLESCLAGSSEIKCKSLGP